MGILIARDLYTCFFAKIPSALFQERTMLYFCWQRILRLAGILDGLSLLIIVADSSSVANRIFVAHHDEPTWYDSPDSANLAITTQNQPLLGFSKFHTTKRVHHVQNSTNHQLISLSRYSWMMALRFGVYTRSLGRSGRFVKPFCCILLHVVVLDHTMDQKIWSPGSEMSRFVGKLRRRMDF